MILHVSTLHAIQVPRIPLSLDAYDQHVSTYIPPEQENYTKHLLSHNEQTQRLKQFYLHYYATSADGLSPWSAALVNAVLPAVKNSEQEILAYFNNHKRQGLDKHYGENFKLHNRSWWLKLQKKANLNALQQVAFQAKNRAIVTRNTLSRALPDDAPTFFDERIPGEGFPFDNLQISSIWAGTPVYVIHTSDDKAWSLVLTPDAYYAWVKSEDIAYVSNDFIKKWQYLAQKQLGAVTKTGVSVFNQQKDFLFSAYIGGVYPIENIQAQYARIYIPVKNADQQAEIHVGLIQADSIRLMPLSATPKHFAALIQQLQNRPYGWGGSFFYNDCSLELKNLFTPFGIWLPRTSQLQANLNKSIDLSAYTLDERLDLIQKKGKALLTLIYKPGHVMLYVGKKKLNQRWEVMSYQNVWALAPKHHDTRYVIGGSVFLPILKKYPENIEINSQANETHLKLIYLDEQLPDPSPQAFANRFK